MATATRPLSCVEGMVPLFFHRPSKHVAVEQIDESENWLITVIPPVPCYRCGFASHHFVATGDDQQFKASPCVVCHNGDEEVR
jgi:hypothetical protein